jgi:hypothetical protein
MSPLFRATRAAATVTVRLIREHGLAISGSVGRPLRSAAIKKDFHL